MKTTILASILFLMTLSPANAQEKIALWKEVNAFPRAHTSLTIFRPKASVDKKTGVIVCPGGSYCYLGMKKEGYDVAKKLAEQGFTAFVLRYRVGMHRAQHPDMVQDLQRAIQWVRDKADECKLQVEKVGVMGFSAGGHLVGTAATYGDHNFLEDVGLDRPVSLKPDFAVMVYPVVSMRDPHAHKKSRKSLLGAHPNEQEVRELSLEENVHAKMPPVLILHAKDDPTVDWENSQMMCNKMKEVKADVTFILYEDGGHGFGAHPPEKAQMASWFQDFMNWYSLKNEKL